MDSSRVNSASSFWSSPDRESGVIVFVALGVIVVSLAIYGLFINFSIQRISHNEASALTRAMALAAVRASTERVCLAHESIQDCRAEREKLAKDAATSVFQRGRVVGATVSDQDIALRAGQYARHPLCPTSRACFLDLETLDEAGELGQPNAYEVSLSYLFERNPFSMVFRPGSVQQEAAATATIVPRRVIFVNDISPSAARENYCRWRSARDEHGALLEPWRPEVGRIHDFLVPIVNIEEFNSDRISPPPLEELEISFIKRTQTEWLLSCYPNSEQPSAMGWNCAPATTPPDDDDGDNDMDADDSDIDWGADDDAADDDEDTVEEENVAEEEEEWWSSLYENYGAERQSMMAAVGEPAYQRLPSSNLYTCAPGVPANEVFADQMRIQYVVGDKFYDSMRIDYLATSGGLPYPHPDPLLNPAFSHGYDGTWVLVDGRPNAHPEPLTTILQGARVAIEELKARRVDGDMFSLINYADGSLWSNTLLLTADLDYALTLLDFETELPLPHADPYHRDDYEVMMRGIEGRELSLRMGILAPGVLNHTNSYAALRLAMNHLQMESTSDLPSAPMVIHFSDGLANCTNLHCASPPCIPLCNDTYSTHLDALAELRGLALQFGNIGVPIHSVLVSSGVASTRVVYDNPDQADDEEGGQVGCLTQEQVRLGIDWRNLLGDTNLLHSRGFFTAGGNLAGLNDPPYMSESFYDDSIPYFEANFQKELQAIYSDGKFFALRPRHADCPLDCVPGDLRKECDMSCPQGALRLLHDPSCLDYQDQIAQFIRSLLGEIPYAIVESK